MAQQTRTILKTYFETGDTPTQAQFIDLIDSSPNPTDDGTTGSGSYVRATSPTLVTPSLGTPSSGTLTNCTGLPQAGTVGLTTTDSPQFAAVNVGHASDTTLSRSAAGQLAVEGVDVLTTSNTKTLTNKSIDADTNTITNIDNADIKAGAAIAVNKLAALTASELVVTDASGFITTATGVSATEAGYLNGVTSAIQTQLDAKQPLDSDLTTIAGLTATTDNFIQAKSSAWASRTPTQVTADLIAFVGDAGSGGTKGLVPAPATGDSTKFLKGDGTWTSIPGGGDALVANPLSQFAATTSAQLAGVMSDETGSGALVFATSPTLVTPTIGVATATSVNKVAITAPATSATLTVADGKTLTASNTITLTGTDSVSMNVTNNKLATLTFIIDGGGSAITTGVKGDIEVPFACTITAARMFADQSGSIVVDIWKDTYANYPATVADTITASAKPTISSTTKSQDTTLTGWTTSISAGDVLRFNVDSASTVTRVTLSLTVNKT